MSVWTPAPEHQGDAPHAHVVQVANGQQHALLLTDEGIVYSWGGNNDKGQLGRSGPHLQPSPVTDPIRDEVILQIACGLQHCLVLTQQGVLYAWGYNKAGQVGVDGFRANMPPKELEVRKPTIVRGFNGKDPARIARSISCGPESSACITTNGEVYVWGAASYYFFNLGRDYNQGETFSIPVRVRGVAEAIKPLAGRNQQAYAPAQVAIYKNHFACTVAHKNLPDQLENAINSLKQRSAHFATVIKAAKAADSPAVNKGAFGSDLPEETKAMNRELRQKRQEIDEQINKIKREQARVNAELTRIGRELTICDQQDTALEEFTSNKQARSLRAANRAGETAETPIDGQARPAGTPVPATADTKALDTELNDIQYFKDSMKASKLQFYEQRDILGKESQQLQKELSLAMQVRQQIDGQKKLIESIKLGNYSGSAEASGDNGLAMAVSKCTELSATDPQTLAGNGRWTGFGQVINVSERALSDVSSALKEVSAASASGGSVLESVLELNLKLRKECVEMVKQKLELAERGTSLSKNQRSAAVGGKDETFKGMVGFFNEVSKSASRKSKGPEAAPQPLQNGMFAVLDSAEGFFGGLMGHT